MYIVQTRQPHHYYYVFLSSPILFTQFELRLNPMAAKINQLNEHKDAKCETKCRKHLKSETNSSISIESSATV